MTLAAWFHDLNPIILRLWGDLAIRWYGLSYVAGFVIAYAIMMALSRRGKILIPPHRVPDAMLWFVGGVLLGGRLGYALFYDPSFHILLGFSARPPFWALFEINKGGMASHGGIAGVTLAAWRVSRGWTEPDPATGRPTVVGRCPMLHACDVLALICPVGLGLGRVANFVNGELLGRIVTPAGIPGPWWAVQYPQELDWMRVDEATGLTAPDPGRLSQTPEQWARIVDLAREVAPRARSDAAAIGTLVARAHDHVERLRPLIASRHPSQLYQAATDGLILGAVLWLAWMKPRRPGVIGGLFLITYGVLRVLTEFIRLPDAHLAQGHIAGLSRGQWLSVLMAAAGAGVLAYALRRPGPAIGGWRTPAPVTRA